MVQKSDYLPAFCPGGCVLPDVVRIGDAVVQPADHQGRRVSIGRTDGLLEREGVRLG